MSSVALVPESITIAPVEPQESSCAANPQVGGDSNAAAAQKTITKVSQPHLPTKILRAIGRAARFTPIEPEFVYFIEAVGARKVKIGYTTRPSVRLKSIKTASPVPLRYVRILRGDLDTESDFHAAFKAERLEGEWFRLTPRLRATIEALSCLEATSNGGRYSFPPRGICAHIDARCAQEENTLGEMYQRDGLADHEWRWKPGVVSTTPHAKRVVSFDPPRKRTRVARGERA